MRAGGRADGPPGGAWAGVLGVGIDAVDLDRFAHALDRRPRIAGRLFTEAERDYASAAARPVRRLATRFAAKEAAMKALGVGLGTVRFVEIEVVRSGTGPPSLVLRGRALRTAETTGVRRWHLSLSHTDRVAVAVAVAVGPGTSKPPVTAPVAKAP